MIWVIYKKKNTLEAPKAIPFDNDSADIANEWILQKEKDYQILDVAFSERE